MPLNCNFYSKLTLVRKRKLVSRFQKGNRRLIPCIPQSSCSYNTREFMVSVVNGKLVDFVTAACSSIPDLLKLC